LGNGTTGGPDGESGYDTPQEVTGITDAVSVSNDPLSYCAVLSSGGVDCWGQNIDGGLGNGTTGGPDGDDGYDTPQAVTGITDAVSVGGDNYGNFNSYCTLLSSGRMDCWGDNAYGELGNGTTGGPDGESGYDTPQAVTGITDAVSVGVDGVGYCAVLSSGGLDCWGYNAYGELGNGTINGPDGDSGYDTPQVVTGITDAVSVSGDNDATYNSYCAVLSSGGVDCWGYNYNGQSGNGTTGGPDSCAGGDYCYDTPQAVTGITDAVSVVGDDSAGYCAVLSSGGVDCWGANGAGELGNGTINGPDADGYDTPQAVTGITDAVSLGSSNEPFSSCVVLSSREVDCWGINSYGQLGNGTTGGPDGVYGYDTPQAVLAS
jgi:alpha-tubulin suppressor-like RCC1 family protein